MKSILSVIIFLFSFQLIAQTTIVDNRFEFKFKKAIKNSRNFEVHTSEYFIKANKDQKKIQIRFKIKSLSRKKEDFDPNKFYLVSDTYKKRLRPIDMKHNFAMSTYIGFDKLINEPHKDRKEVYWYNYKPEIKDTFLEYPIAGYEDIDNCINFGTKRKSRNKSIYFDHKQLKSNTVDVYFIVPKSFKTGKLYFGEALVADFKVK